MFFVVLLNSSRTRISIISHSFNWNDFVNRLHFTHAVFRTVLSAEAQKRLLETAQTRVASMGHCVGLRRFFLDWLRVSSGVGTRSETLSSLFLHPTS